MTDYGAFVDVGAEVDGFLHIVDVPYRARGQPARATFDAGMRVKVWAKEVDLDARRVKLSAEPPSAARAREMGHRAPRDRRTRDAAARYATTSADRPAFDGFGDEREFAGVRAPYKPRRRRESTFRLGGGGARYRDAPGEGGGGDARP